jgi:hypothetical protein
MSKYSVFEGDFVCHTCKASVSTSRLYYDKKIITWMCKDKHLSQVILNTKKSKKDYERAK